MKNILLPTDFSDNSWNAIEYALQMYKDQPCTFYILHVYSPVIYQFEYAQSAAIQLQMMENEREIATKNLDKFLQKISSNYKNQNHTFLKKTSYNTLSSAIEEVNENTNLDGIIMGTKGASGLKEILFGSNTVHVLKNSKCPVLAIPSNFTFEEPHEILFPTDFEVDFQKRHLQPIINIATMYHSRVSVLHVYLKNALSELQEQNREKLEGYFTNTSYLVKYLKHDNIPEAISQFQSKARVNMLAMINNKHSFFENLFFSSTINQIGFHLNIPFLVIPSKV